VNKLDVNARAKIGIFAALAAMFSGDKGDAKRSTSVLKDFSIVPHHHNRDRRQLKTGMPGSKLIKKMHRQPAKIGKDPAIFARKVRRQIVNQARKASKDFQAKREARIRYAREHIFAF